MLVLFVVLLTAVVVVSFVTFMSRFERNKDQNYYYTVDSSTSVDRHIFNQKFNLYGVSNLHYDNKKDI